MSHSQITLRSLLIVFWKAKPKRLSLHRGGLVLPLLTLDCTQLLIGSTLVVYRLGCVTSCLFHVSPCHISAVSRLSCVTSWLRHTSVVIGRLNRDEVVPEADIEGNSAGGQKKVNCCSCVTVVFIA